MAQPIVLSERAGQVLPQWASYRQQSTGAEYRIFIDALNFTHSTDAHLAASTVAKRQVRDWLGERVINLFA